ncbi:Six-hairpin glycosidase-like protein [Kockovaella imperatae]|uniref:Six-hairpin glycosidase-like protein n=1 Tax=Kockovaella imperatae TaxID=4999 RepID=A0A1Y1UPK6_9TREE|nr:Six-hairpin glycosidase-like protein [Kockovaella imperatae]ORX39444.1 Six-hairpin glycosidase-like protein [Kockovaella imperatae]
MTHRTLLVLGLLARWAEATHLRPSRIQQVWDVMNQISVYSWENGTRAEALLEYNYPSLSPISSSSPFPLPQNLNTDQFSQVYDLAHMTMQNRNSSTSTDSPFQGATLLPDGAAGDPASLGISVLLANVSTHNEQVNGIGYGDAAREELDYLLYDVPRTSSGAISHRADQAQLWSDSVYMVPPFLAYYGVLHNNQSLIQEAYTQCSLYRQALKTDNNLWMHIVDGSGFLDYGCWATGNGWAAAGMLRVLATIKYSQFSSAMQQQQSDLQSWIEEILTAASGYISKNGLLHNYINDTGTFEDAASSALFAATGYRLSTIGLTNAHVNMSSQLLSAVSSKVNSTGFVTQVVDPLSFGEQGKASPEAQSFLIMAYAAFNDWNSTGRAGSGDSDDDPLGNYGGATTIDRPVELIIALAALLWAVL